EKELIDSMIRNMKRHTATEQTEGLDYAQWQAEQLAALQDYRKRNTKTFKGYFSAINDEIEEAIRKAYKIGGMDQEIKILEALKKGYKTRLTGKPGETSAEFFKINDRKINALINATVSDMQRAETAMLRMANDEYRKVIFNTNVYYQSGAGTLEKAVDMATKDFLSRGLNCVEYANGARVPIDSYAQMAIRTTATRAYLTGEAAKRDEWGINTVMVNKRGVACPMCLQWVGKVYYDDVWGSVPATDSKYPRLSEAIHGGLWQTLQRPPRQRRRPSSRRRQPRNLYRKRVTTPPCLNC
ncbi:MAG: hypothetical protein PHX61_10905, partial [Alphaproteobacteria bacterium]|nr:hypothetical protein [Alphaproteobacteria bacterium]